ncbi:MAG: DUF3341 domain-containing protein [Acetobacteraceae bacterium]|nr:DUF3341 domain-containing protein [Acetobacteraceae bacterium]
MIVAGFPDAGSLLHAVQALRERGAAVETRTPVALPDDEDGKSRIPLVVLVCALAIAAAGFFMQWYATTVGYRLLIGGRPNFFWTSYLVYAFECGVLAATSTAFIAFLAANRLPRLWEPADECDSLREATRDGWFLVTDGEDARTVLAKLHPTSLEQVPG